MTLKPLFHLSSYLCSLQELGLLEGKEWPWARPEVALIEPLEKPISSLLRGFWIAKAQNTVCISKIDDVIDNVIMNERVIYDLKQIDATLENNSDVLQTLSVLTKALEIEEIRLEKEKFGYLRLTHKSE